MSDDRSAIEKLIRDACEAEDFEQAATLTVEHYGPELLGFLEGLMRDADAAGEVFQQWSELFWRTLPSFQWRCSARTWAYKLARRAACDHGRREHKHGRARPLTDLSRLSAAVERMRTTTTAYRRTDVKHQFQQLREQLSPEDQSLLTLRVERGLQWHELAEIMLGDEATPTELQLKAEAARLRKRFQLIRERLRKMAQEAGLIGTP